MNAAEATTAVELMLNNANVAGQPRVDVFVGTTDDVTFDSDGGAHPYAVIYPSPGQRDLRDASLDGTNGARAFRFQVTAAGGDVSRCMRAMLRVQSVLVDQTIDGTTGFIREDGDPGYIREDRTVRPIRWYVPLLYVVDLP